MFSHRHRALRAERRLSLNVALKHQPIGTMTFACRKRISAAKIGLKIGVRTISTNNKNIERIVTIKISDERSIVKLKTGIAVMRSKVFRPNQASVITVKSHHFTAISTEDDIERRIIIYVGQRSSPERLLKPRNSIAPFISARVG